MRHFRLFNTKLASASISQPTILAPYRLPTCWRRARVGCETSRAMKIEFSVLAVTPMGEAWSSMRGNNISVPRCSMVLIPAFSNAPRRCSGRRSTECAAGKRSTHIHAHIIGYSAHTILSIACTTQHLKRTYTALNRGVSPKSFFRESAECGR